MHIGNGEPFAARERRERVQPEPPAPCANPVRAIGGATLGKPVRISSSDVCREVELRGIGAWRALVRAMLGPQPRPTLDERAGSFGLAAFVMLPAGQPCFKVAIIAAKP